VASAAVCGGEIRRVGAEGGGFAGGSRLALSTGLVSPDPVGCGGGK